MLIDAITWKRAILTLSCRWDPAHEDAERTGGDGIAFAGEETGDALYLRRADGSEKIPLEIQREGGRFIARLNLMQAPGRGPLPEGDWMLDTQQGGEEICFSDTLLADLDRYMRFFPYAQGKYLYTVRFIVRESPSHRPLAALRTGFYMHNPRPRIRRRSVRFLEKRIFHAVYRFLSRMAGRKGNRILFLKQNGDAPSDNMASLIRRMRERGIEDTFEITCRCRNVFSGGQSVWEWMKDLRLIAKSDYIFIDDYAPVFDFIDLDDHVVLTQLWHAGVGFKSVGYARFGLDGSPDPYSSAHRHYTYALVGNEHLREIYSEVFGIEPQALLATGMPRLDHFLEPQAAQEAEEEMDRRFPMLQHRRTVLFAPTYRGTGQRTAYYPYDCLDQDALYQMCVDTDSCFIYKMHHFISERPLIRPAYADRILDLTDEPLSSLMYTADVLVTDYSSCFYDYLLLKKPVILYVPDLMVYTAVHGVQRSPEEMAPGEICRSFETLLDTLYTGAYQRTKPKAQMIDRAAEKGALASDRVIDTVLYGKEVPGVRLRMRNAPASGGRSES